MLILAETKEMAQEVLEALIWGSVGISFTKTLKPVIALLREMGVRIIVYIDSFFLLLEAAGFTETLATAFAALWLLSRMYPTMPFYTMTMPLAPSISPPCTTPMHSIQIKNTCLCVVIYWTNLIQKVTLLKNPAYLIHA